MNNVCLCVGKYAKNPYYVKFSDISLYSMEELCYYFMDKVYLLDESIVAMDLVFWIRNECGLAELADELEVFVRKRVSVSAFVTTILEKTGMYDSNTIRRIERVLKEQTNMTPSEKYKKRADYLYQQGRFRQALAIYTELADYLSEKEDTAKALMYYNMASIYAMDFAYAQAADFYYQSYLLRSDKQTKIAYILAKRMSLSDYAYGSFKRENPGWEQDFSEAELVYEQTQEKWQTSKEKGIVDEITGLKSSGKRDSYYMRMDAVTGQLKNDYRRQTKE